MGSVEIGGQASGLDEKWVEGRFQMKEQWPKEVIKMGDFWMRCMSLLGDTDRLKPNQMAG